MRIFTTLLWSYGSVVDTYIKSRQMIGRSQCDARKCWLSRSHSAEQKPNKSLKVFRRQRFVAFSSFAQSILRCCKFTVWTRWILPLSHCVRLRISCIVLISQQLLCFRRSTLVCASRAHFSRILLVIRAAPAHTRSTVRRPLVILCESAFQRNNDIKFIRAESEEGVRMTTMTH